MFELELMDKVIVSHDTEQFTFKLPQEDQVMGLPVGGHVCIHAKHGEDIVTRKYTPIS